MTNYFQNMKSSELAELQHELNSLKPEEKREAAKQVIAMMTIGKDVSSLFPHMVKCMETTQMELKKLVYLYIINYAKVKPDLTIMAVNSFQKDSRDIQSPMMRALAVRTMGCIRVERITEYMCESLKERLNDQDPYVKKTAALGVAKLFQTSPRLVKDHSLIKILQGMLYDGNAVVVANAAASLLEISRASGKNYLRLKNDQGLNKLLIALNDANEWGKIYILEGISSYDTSDSKESENIVERVLPMLTHNNPAVILSAVKTVLKFMNNVSTQDLLKGIIKKLGPPLITLLSTEAEIQYVALRNINFILQKYSHLFEQNVRVFFCKYNDPVYVKLEKIDILVKVADDKNVETILAELKEYSGDIDPELVKKSVRAIGQIILKVDKAASKAVEIIHEIVTQGGEIGVQEAVIVAKDIFRKFPDKYESLIKQLCLKLDDYNEPESKASIIWIIGEYAEKINEAEALIERFADSFIEDHDKVKLSLLTAAVKLYLKKPDEGEQIIQRVLKLATEEADNPDLRDRAYIYWRMLSTSPQKTKYVVLGDKPNISEDSYNQYNEDLISSLIDQISTLSSIYHKTPEDLALMQRRTLQVPAAKKDEAKKEDEAEESKERSKSPTNKKTRAKAKKSDDESEEKPKLKPKKHPELEKPISSKNKKDEPAPVTIQPVSNGIDIDDLLGMGDSTPQSYQQTSQQQNALSGLDFGYGNQFQQQQQQQIQPLNQFQQIQQQNTSPFGQQNLFGATNDHEDDGGMGWANMGAFGSTPEVKLTLDFAYPPLKEALSQHTKNPKGNSGIQVKAVFRKKENTNLVVDLEIINHTQQPISDFDLMFNKNPFGIAIYNAASIFRPIGPGQNAEFSLPCVIDKKNLDAKNPPKSPFMVESALKTNLDVFYFNIHCMLHCLIDQSQPMSREDFKKFWEMIPKANETSMSFDSLYGAFTQSGDVPASLIDGLKKNGFENLAKVTKADTQQTMLYFGAFTINKLPLLLEIANPHNGNTQSAQVLFKIPVMPLKPLLIEAIEYILVRKA